MTIIYPKASITSSKNGHYTVTVRYGKDVVFKQSHIENHKSARAIVTEFLNNFKG
jgi:hypothetical protein